MAQLNLITSDQAWCSFCNDHIENIHHLFFSCMYSWQVWAYVLNWWGIQSPIHHTPTSFMSYWSSLVMTNSKFKEQLWSSMFFIVVWSLWFTRNQIKIQYQDFTLQTLQHDIKLILGMWIKRYTLHSPTPSFKWLLLGIVCRIGLSHTRIRQIINID